MVAGGARRLSSLSASNGPKGDPRFLSKREPRGPDDFGELAHSGDARISYDTSLSCVSNLSGLAFGWPSVSDALVGVVQVAICALCYNS